jgi:hypothetical protein
LGISGGAGRVFAVHNDCAAPIIGIVEIRIIAGIPEIIAVPGIIRIPEAITKAHANVRAAIAIIATYS